jgi:ribonuclease G
MNKEMIISSGDHDTRVAILEDDQAVEIFIERERSRGVVGNIYKGRVSKVLPGMQSSFVDIGLERDAFLYVTEVVNTVAELDRLEAGDDEDDEPGVAPVRAVAPVEVPSQPPAGEAGHAGDALAGETGHAGEALPRWRLQLRRPPPAPRLAPTSVPSAAAATATATARRSGRKPRSRTC